MEGDTPETNSEKCGEVVQEMHKFKLLMKQSYTNVK